jgi:trehalose 6-phosphate synthase/phosphatase
VVNEGGVVEHRVILVSNRLPVSVRRVNGKLHLHPSIGGLATALSSIHSKHGWLWVGWPGARFSSRQVESVLESELNCHPVFLSAKEVEKYYHGFCNRTLWPLLHYFPKATRYDYSEWNYYRRVNQKFCDKVLDVTRPGDVIWIHDYHLMLLPTMLRRHLAEAKIGFFLHTPFPPPEIFCLLPWRREIIEGILGADLIGFQTLEYANNFLDSVLILLGKSHELGKIYVEDRGLVKVGAFPIGIDFEKWFNAGGDPRTIREARKFKKIIGERKVILSFSRLEYTKGIPEQLEAFDAFLEQHPEWHEKVALILAVSPSRMETREYQLLKREVDEIVGRINGKYSTIGWTPILYLHRTLPFHTLAALYVMADVALITPLRDGMNLIAMEYVAACSNGSGVLILSETAGAAKELGEAILVNPNDKQEVSDALNAALRMPVEEQALRNRRMQERLRSRDVEAWARLFLEQLLEVKEIQEALRAKVIDDEIKRDLVLDYHRGSPRLLLLDYDGTLVPIREEPQESAPDEDLIDLLRRLAEPEENEVVLISGRDRATLDEWFRGLNVTLVGEHGAWLKRPGSSWELMEPLTSSWKREIRPILQMYADRVLGSFIEEKEFSIAWHYRKAETEYGESLARELARLLTSMTASFDVEVLHGKKVIEVKSAGVNKGRVALRLLSSRSFQFILAMGDDFTDESMFRALPKWAYTIKVGVEPSFARLNLSSQSDVVPLLRELISLTEEVDKGVKPSIPLVSRRRPLSPQGFERSINAGSSM